MAIRRVMVGLLAAVVLAIPTTSVAQSERGGISGRIADATKAGLPGVAVTITNTATNQATSVFSSEVGTYSAANLPPGPYRVEATLSGFRTTRTDVQLSAGANARIDLTLEVGGVTEAVTVVANNSLLQTTDARTSTNVPNQLIDQLPLVVGGAMRSVFDLVGTVAESKGTGANVALGGGQGGAFGATLVVGIARTTAASKPTITRLIAICPPLRLLSAQTCLT